MANNCSFRPISTVPLQSLALLNDEFVRARAQALARRLEREAGSAQEKRLALAFRWVYGRPATDAEQAAARRFLAGQKQLLAPQTGESRETRRLYGLDNPETAEYGGRCLLDRRLVEHGVRFVQVFLNGQPWDTHSKNAEQLRRLCARTDRPSAALVMDLKRRGLLDSTVVLWTGEFGRLPVSQGADGRDHNRHAFSLWLAGGGFRGGCIHGATDDFGYRAVQEVVRVPDLHATLLHTLGLDHERLTYPHDGREDTLTDANVSRARIVTQLLA